MIHAWFLFLACGLWGKLQQEWDPRQQGKLQNHQHWEPPAAPGGFYSYHGVVNLCCWAASSGILHGFLLSMPLPQLLFLTPFFFLFHFSFASPQETSQPSPSFSASTLAASMAPSPPAVRFTSAAAARGRASWLARDAVQVAGPVCWLGCAAPRMVKPVLGSF